MTTQIKQQLSNAIKDLNTATAIEEQAHYQGRVDMFRQCLNNHSTANVEAAIDAIQNDTSNYAAGCIWALRQVLRA